MITGASADVFGISSPREFQHVGIYHCITNDDTVLAVPRKTSDGKSLVVQLASFFRKGVTFYLEPLLGLASDQVDRATVEEHSMEAYHVDEHRKEDQQLLIDRLRSYNVDGEETAHVSINLFIGPRAMNSNTWKTELTRLAEHGLIQMMVIDEAHYISQSGRHFRPEFITAVEFLRELLKKMPVRVLRVLLSATMVRSDVDLTVKLLGNKAPTILHGKLDRRTISFKVIISGCAASTLKKHARRDLKKRPHKQQIWYTSSRTKAEGSLRDVADKLLEENRLENNGPNSVSQSFVGTDGITLKTTNLDGIKQYPSLEGKGTVLLPSTYPTIARSMTTGSPTSNEDKILLT